MVNALHNVNWAQFEKVNPNTTTAFEDLSRMIFRKHFLPIDTILNAKPNHPGIEVFPTLDKTGNNMVSFQAKYFSSKTDYEQIRHSISLAVEKYGGTLDLIYLFCNKTIDVESNSFQKIIKIATNESIKIKLLTNDEILDIAINYPTVYNKFFNQNFLDNQWFDQQTKISIESMGERYNSFFNVTTETEEAFSLFANAMKARIIINRKIDNALSITEDILKSSTESKVKSLTIQIRKILEQYKLKDENNIGEYLSWRERIERQAKDIFDELLEMENVFDKALETEIDQEKQSLISRKLRQIYRLKNIPYTIQVSDTEKNLIMDKVLIITGETGTGKTQMLSQAAVDLHNEGGYSILVAGRVLMTQDEVGKQVVEALGLSISFSELLLILESVGEYSQKKVFIIFDGINESNSKDIWKNGLSRIIEEINKYNNLRLIISVRDGYEKLVFPNSILELIEKQKIAHLIHFGFLNNEVESVREFLNYYKIPFSPTYYFQYQMTNPLFLTMFCKVSRGEVFDFYDLLDHYIDYADEEVQKSIGLDGDVKILKELIYEIGEYHLDHDTNTIPLKNLMTLSFWDAYGVSAHKVKVVSSLRKNGILLPFVNRKTREEEFSFGYNLLEDFIYAQSIVNKNPDVQDLVQYIKEDFLEIRQGDIIKRHNIDTFIIICSLFRQRFNEECIGIVEQVEEELQWDVYDKYLESFSWRPANISDKKTFQDFFKGRNINPNTLFTMLISNSTRINHELNAKFLHEYLFNLPLNKRDFCWTLEINQSASLNDRIYQLVKYFEEGNSSGDDFRKDEVSLLSILFTWLLSSSNRTLRDQTSKALVEIMKKDFSLCKYLLDKFEGVNDPYIAQRLHGIVFGACMKNESISKTDFKDLVSSVYQSVFCQEIVYPDILLRDYARLIIERFLFLYPEETKNIDYKKVTPPYKSCIVPRNTKDIDYDRMSNGMKTIARSMAPEHSRLMYGDFGRYVFESALKDFGDLDMNAIYNYSLSFIENELGYNEEYFGNFDRYSNSHNYERHNSVKMERIGKKYQWIAMYNILARISDEIIQLKYWNDAESSYTGPWEPYVRDFDPTLNQAFLANPILAIFENNELPNNDFINHDADSDQIQDWINRSTDDFMKMKKNLLSQDEEGHQWITLYRHNQTESDEDIHDPISIGFKRGTQRVWSIINGYLVNTEDFDSFWIEANKVTDLVRRLPDSANPTYCFYNREYGWAEATNNYFEYFWDDFKVETGEFVKETIPLLPKIKFKDDIDFENLDFENLDSEGIENIIIDIIHESENNEEIVEKPVTKSIAKVRQASTHFLWEEQYDASQEDVTAFYIPCQQIINGLNLTQKEFDGYYYDKDDVLVAYDGNITNQEYGLIMRKDYLERYLEESGLYFVWNIIGEKQYFLDENGTKGQEWTEWGGLFRMNGQDIDGDFVKSKGHR